jgi:two-component system, OmpR family, sensor histidine kinase KdpD
MRMTASIAGVGAITAVCKMLPINETAASLCFLLFILVVATGWGLSPAIVASLTATVLFNFYFLPPVGTLTIADPQNWIALVAFLITAVIASELSNRTQRETQAAVEQRREVERLYELSRAVLLDTGENAVGSDMAQQLVSTFGFDSVLFYDLRIHKVYCAGTQDLNPPAEELERVQDTTALVDGTHATPVRLGNKSVGVLAIRGEVGKPALEAIANLLAITVERAASQEAASQALAAKKSEELKSSILDALAHEFKTPLTSIKAASTALLSKASEQNDNQRELLTIIDEETDRLTHLVTDAIQASHIEAGRVKLTKLPTNVSGLLHGVVERMKTRLDDRRVDLDIDEALPEVMLDRELMELAVGQLVDNALKYSPPGTPITLQARAAPAAVRLSVADIGPPISLHEQQRIFEKFYRGEANRHRLPGTGLGLNIVKDIVCAHSGTVRVESKAGVGTKFTIELPAQDGRA